MVIGYLFWASSYWSPLVLVDGGREGEGERMGGRKQSIFFSLFYAMESLWGNVCPPLLVKVNAYRNTHSHLRMNTWSEGWLKRFEKFELQYSKSKALSRSC